MFTLKSVHISSNKYMVWPNHSRKIAERAIFAIFWSTKLCIRSMCGDKSSWLYSMCGAKSALLFTWKGAMHTLFLPMSVNIVSGTKKWQKCNCCQFWEIIYSYQICLVDYMTYMNTFEREKYCEEEYLKSNGHFKKKYISKFTIIT